MIYLANIFQPIVDVFNNVIVFFHDHIGLSWGVAIIGLTICVRALMLPLAFKQYSSMRGMAEAAPHLKEMQKKYKDDKQRLQQEQMKFYKENKINPFASCMPLLLQLPIFLALFYALRTDLRDDMCPTPSYVHVDKPLACSDLATNPKYLDHLHSIGQSVPNFHEGFLFVPDITAPATGWVLAVLISLYIGSQLISSFLMANAAQDKNQRLIFMALPFVMVLFVFRFPAGLIVYWITTNLWTILQQQGIKRVLGPPKLPEKDPNEPEVGMFEQLKSAVTGEDPVPKAAAVAAADAGRTKAPPPPPRRKRKRSGKRR
jgi:YidC/Oxa1 family membrane protein insertase